MAESKNAAAAYAALARELAEARAFQAATDDLLRIIKCPATDPKPAFEAIVGTCHRLCAADNTGLWLLRDDGQVELVRVYSSDHVDGLPTLTLAPAETTATGLAMQRRETLHYPAINAETECPSMLRAWCDRIGPYSIVIAPMLSEGRGIGSLTLFRQPPRAFTPAEISLLQNFADQAVIAVENARLIRETQEALERQTATAEILQIISASPTDVQPVFDAITERAMVLSKSALGVMMRFDGESQDVMAIRGLSPAGEAAFRALWPQKLTPDDSSARAILAGSPVQIPDYASERGRAALVFLDAQESIRGALSVPLIREGHCIGTINLGRPEPGNFPQETVTMLQTFAAQAVIAIENVRLFNETKEALEQQTASAEVLRVISSSVADTAPVFEKILDSCESLFTADEVGIFLVRADGQLDVAGFRGDGSEAVRRTYPRPLAETATAQAILERRTIHIADTATVVDSLPPSLRGMRERVGDYSLVYAPLIRDGQGIGSLALVRNPPRAFTDKEITLLTTFADQAVIAIANAAMFRETQEALERQTALSDILRVISESPTDVQPVFDAIAERAAALCRAPSGYSFRFDGELAHLVGVVGLSPETEDAIRQGFPIKPDRSSVTGRIVLGAAPVHVADLTAEAESNVKVRPMLSAGIRSFLGVPMLREGKVIGGLGVSRAEPGRFSDALVTLLQTFAAQAVIAVENVRLFNETREALEQQTASAEVLRVISSSVADVQPVFEKILDSCEALFEVDNMTVMLVRDGQAYPVVARGAWAERVVQRGTRPLEDTAVAQRFQEGRAMHIPNAAAVADSLPPALRWGFYQFGNYSGVVAPLLRDGHGIGTIGLYRSPPKPFTDKEIALVTSFADQAVIAIENARLFRETQEALEQQTASAEVLRVIASSVADAQPVLEKILDSCEALFDVNQLSINLIHDDGQLHIAATRGQQSELIRQAYPMPVSESMTALACDAGRTMHIPNVGAELDTLPAGIRATYERIGNFSVLFAPLLRDGQGIGSIALGRYPPRPFSIKEIALLTTFADQAVIAIENARLFRETQEALERQTAMSDILRVISESPTDVQPVFDAIAERARLLCNADGGIVTTFDGTLLHLASMRAPQDISLPRSAALSMFPLPPSRATLAGRAVLERAPVEIANVQTDPEYIFANQTESNGSGLAVPMLREGDVVGTIMIFRRTTGHFAPGIVSLLTVFAAQAVIAIENVRLFKETREALEHQTASAEVLRVISSSVADAQPVFEKILDSCQALFGVEQVSINLVLDDGRVHAGGWRGEIMAEAEKFLPVAVDESVTGLAIRERRAIHVPDAAAGASPYRVMQIAYERLGNYSSVFCALTA